MHPNPNALDRKARTRRGLALAGALALGAAAGCGGKAVDDAGGGAPADDLGGARFLFSCEREPCRAGFACVTGVCTRPCSNDAACSEASPRASCRQDPTSEWNGFCVVQCSSDYGCRSLGAGSFCRRGRCTAGDLDALPEAFERIELRRLDESALAGAAAPCGPNAVTTRIEVNLRTRRLSWSACSREATDGTGLVTGRAALDDRSVARVLDEYRQLRPLRAQRCAGGTPLFTVELEPERGTMLLFSDAEHSDCKAPYLEHGSFLEGLNGFYATLEELKAALE